jgi:hypothetical protein
MSEGKDEPRKDSGKPASPPAGDGDSLEDAAEEAVRDIERRDGGAGSGDIG